MAKDKKKDKDAKEAKKEAKAKKQEVRRAAQGIVASTKSATEFEINFVRRCMPACLRKWNR